MIRGSGRTRRGWFPALLAVLLTCCCGCAAVLGGQSAATPVPVLDAAQTIQQSLLDLGEAGVLHYRGSLLNPDGKQIGLDVSVTATGEAAGAITAGGVQGAVVVVAGSLYVDAPGTFWSWLVGDPGTLAQAEDSRWVLVPTVTIGVDIGAALVPGVFGGDLNRQVTGATSGSFGTLPGTTVNGVPAVRVVSENADVALAATGPHGVLHVDMPGAFGNASKVSLDVADVTADEAGVYQNISQQAQQLGAAVDTTVDIQQGNQNWGTCTASGCSVIVTFTNASSTATKVVVSGNWKGDGKPVGTCQSIVGPVPAGRSTTASCTDAAAEWTAFYNQAHATAGDHPYEVDWTAEALAAPPNLAPLTAEANAAATPADPKRAGGSAFVYVIDYQDTAGRTRPWKYGVAANTSWQARATGQLTACRAQTRTSCTVGLVAGAASRPSADALAASLVSKAASGGGCPPGQWVDCAGSAR